MKIISEGVLILASSKALIKEYKNKEFDYSFPEGIVNLLKEHKIIALTTSEGDNLIVELENTDKNSSVKYIKEIDQTIKLEKKDDLLILSHAEFTMICSKGGDYRDYKWPIQKIENLDPGMYDVTIKVESLADRFEEFKAYFKLTVRMGNRKGVRIVNQVKDISLGD